MTSIEQPIRDAICDTLDAQASHARLWSERSRATAEKSDVLSRAWQTVSECVRAGHEFDAAALMKLLTRDDFRQPITEQIILSIIMPPSKGSAV
jgi:hypothetical protein